jgi:hypothetical protein
MRLVERAARAAEEGDEPALTRLAERMAAAATDALEGDPPDRALDFLLCDVVASLAPNRGGLAAPGGQGTDEPWDAALVRRAERDLDPGAARRVRAAARTVAGGTPDAGTPDADLAGDEPPAAGEHPHAELLRAGVVALAWLRGYARDLVTREPPPVPGAEGA